MHADGLPSGLFLAICERVGMSGELFAQSRRHGGARHTQKGRRVTRYGHAPARAPPVGPTQAWRSPAAQLPPAVNLATDTALWRYNYRQHHTIRAHTSAMYPARRLGGRQNADSGCARSLCAKSFLIGINSTDINERLLVLV